MDEKRYRSLAARAAKVIAANVANLRRGRGLTQTALGAEMGCLKEAVSRLESGRGLPSLATVLKAAHALGVTPCRLLEETK